MIGWKDISTAPENKGYHPYTVTDGKYIERVAWSETLGWYDNGDGWNRASLDPQPLYWISDEDILSLIPLPRS